jgi:hypothetical protein
MIQKYLQKQKKLDKKIKILSGIIKSLNISKEDKELYLKSLDALDENSFNVLYNSFVNFTEELDKKDSEKILKSDFEDYSLKNSNKTEKKQNTFSLLLNNI